jgi:hypothetical protein
MAIHHVEVEGIHARSFGALHFLSQAGIVRGKHGGVDFHGPKRARVHGCNLQSLLLPGQDRPGL